MLEFDIAAGSYLSASESKLKEAWQPIFDDLYTVMTDGTDFSQLPQFMQDAAVQYYDAYIGGIDQQAELAEGDMMRMAGDLTGYVDQMTDFLNQDTDFAEMIHHFDELMQGPVTQESVDEMNAMIPMINEFITAYNRLTETTDDDLPLFSEFTLDGLTEAKENYYEELLNNPRKLIEELKELLSQSDAEIIDWLVKNHEDYETATDATRENMRRGWQEMLDDMRGHTTTYWEEVEEIIAGGDDAIIQFLKDNCQDYKDAGKLQAEAYVDEWKKKLEELRNAYKQVSGDIKAYDYTPTTSAKGSGSSSGGGSGGKKSGGSSTKVTKYKATYPAIGKAKGGTLSGYSSPEEAEKAARSKINSICRELSGSSSGMIGEWARSFYSKIKVTAYAKGGLNQMTGLAWLDGTKAKPERILSPYQTELFEDLLKTLHAIRTVQVPQAVVRPQLPETVQNQPLTIESITVNVERLEKEADYDAMAERVGEKIMERAMRGMAVGGLWLG